MNPTLLLCNISSDIGRLPLSGDTTLSVNLDNFTEGMLIKFDDELMPLSVTQLTIGSSEPGLSMTNNRFNQCIVEPDSNSIIILGSIGRIPQDYGYPVFYGQDLLDIQDNCAWFVRIDNQTGALQSYGYIPSSSQTTSLTNHSILQSIAQKNRIITHVGYKENIQTPDSSISIAPNRFGAGLYICDYDGNYIDFIDYGIDAPSILLSGCLSLHDSILYIMGGSRFDLTLNNTPLSPTGNITEVERRASSLALPRWSNVTAGNSVAYIAKYVDTTFMTPYVYVAPPIDTTHTDTSTVSIPDFSSLNSQFSIYPNPTSGKVTITSPAPLVSAIVTDMMGRQVYTKTIKQSNIVYRTDGTPQAITIDLSHLPQGAYFLTLTTASGKSHTLKLIKQSDIFGH